MVFFLTPHRKVLFHLFMTIITGGLWLIGLVIYFIVKK